MRPLSSFSGFGALSALFGIFSAALVFPSAFGAITAPAGIFLAALAFPSDFGALAALVALASPGGFGALAGIFVHRTVGCECEHFLSCFSCWPTCVP